MGDLRNTNILKRVTTRLTRPHTKHQPNDRHPFPLLGHHWTLGGTVWPILDADAAGCLESPETKKRTGVYFFRGHRRSAGGFLPCHAGPWRFHHGGSRGACHQRGPNAMPIFDKFTDAMGSDPNKSLATLAFQDHSRQVELVLG